MKLKKNWHNTPNQFTVVQFSYLFHLRKMNERDKNEKKKRNPAIHSSDHILFLLLVVEVQEPVYVYMQYTKTNCTCNRRRVYLLSVLNSLYTKKKHIQQSNAMDLNNKLFKWNIVHIQKSFVVFFFFTKAFDSIHFWSNVCKNRTERV